MGILEIAICKEYHSWHDVAISQQAVVHTYVGIYNGKAFRRKLKSKSIF